MIQECEDLARRTLRRMSTEKKRSLLAMLVEAEKDYAEFDARACLEHARMDCAECGAEDL